MCLAGHFESGGVEIRKIEDFRGSLLDDAFFFFMYILLGSSSLLAALSHVYFPDSYAHVVSMGTDVGEPTTTVITPASPSALAVATLLKSGRVRTVGQRGTIHRMCPDAG